MTGSLKTLAAVIPGGSQSENLSDTQDTRALIRTLNTDDPWLGNLLLAKLFIVVNKAYESTLGTSKNSIEEQLISQDLLSQSTPPDIALIFRHGYFEIKYKNENELQDFFFKLIESIGVSKKILRQKYVLNVPWGGYGCENTQPVQLIFEYEHDEKDNDSSVKMYFSDRKIIKDEKPIELTINKDDLDHLNKTYHPEQLKQRAIVAAVSGEETVPELDVEIISDQGKRVSSNTIIGESKKNIKQSKDLFKQHEELISKPNDASKNSLIARMIFCKDDKENVKYYPYENALSYGYDEKNKFIDTPSWWYRFNRWRQYHTPEFWSSVISALVIGFLTCVVMGGVQVGLDQHIIDFGSRVYGILIGVATTIFTAMMLVYHYWGKESYYQRDPQIPEKNYDEWVPFKKVWRSVNYYIDKEPNVFYKFLIALAHISLASIFIMPVLTLGVPLLLANMGYISLPYLSELAEASKVAMLMVSVATVALFQWGRKLWLNQVETDVVREVQLDTNERQNIQMLKLRAYELDRAHYIEKQWLDRNDVPTSTSGEMPSNNNSDGKKRISTQNQITQLQAAPYFTLGFDSGLTEKHVEEARTGVLNCALTLHKKPTISHPNTGKFPDGPIAGMMGGGSLNTLLSHNDKVEKLALKA